MDIYEWAEHNDADYLDYMTGYIYKVHEYVTCVKWNFPNYGIRIVDSMTGETIGFAKRNES